ncbi:hypothetical protein LCGC14_2781890 [marine sediment metagenome]|uniref:30S ribosomal protein S9 n=1 Tax=marine sediment metagenome TaxID=412755 RepID=A0A0F9B1P1_9ZZZZ
MATATSDFLGTGRRKSSVARVRVRPGEGKIMVNKRPLDDYFVRLQDRNSVVAPLEQTGARGEVDVIIRVHGGGITGQADACKLGWEMKLRLSLQCTVEITTSVQTMMRRWRRFWKSHDTKMSRLWSLVPPLILEDTVLPVQRFATN